MKPIPYTDENYPGCAVCKSHLYTTGGGFEHSDGTFTCYRCAHDAPLPSINPLPDHMKALVEPYIVWREDRAVARHVLEQAERLK